MTKAELIQNLKDNLKELNTLTEKLDYLNLKYEMTGDDDRYGGVIESTRDEIDEVNAELEYTAWLIDEMYRVRPKE